MGTKNKTLGSTKPGIVNETHLQARVSRIILSVKRKKRIKKKKNQQETHSLLRQITEKQEAHLHNLGRGWDTDTLRISCHRLSLKGFGI